MRHLSRALAAAGILSAGMAFAHTGVKDPNVKAWMDGMSELASETKSLGLMVRGQADFDPEAATAALAEIEHHARNIPDLFETRASDPTSEAVDSIWTNWNDFVLKSGALADAAAMADPEDIDSLRMAFGSIGQACKACHADYRE